MVGYESSACAELLDQWLVRIARTILYFILSAWWSPLKDHRTHIHLLNVLEQNLKRNDVRQEGLERGQLSFLS